MNQGSEAPAAAARPGFSKLEVLGSRNRTPTSVPTQVSRLLTASGDGAQDDAWADFLEHYSKLLLQTARRASADADESMDRYTFILDQLRDNDFRRLRSFAAEGRGKFTTWLVVVARRLCVDHHRRAFGRPQAARESSHAQSAEHTARRNLATLVAAAVDPDQLEDSRSRSPDSAVLEHERRAALSHALSTLDETDQLLLTLRFDDELPIQTIAPMVGLRSRFQVHRRLNAVLTQLRGVLQEQGFTES